MAKKYIRNSLVEIVTNENGCTFDVLCHGKKIYGDERLLQVYDLFQTPQDIQVILEKYGVPENVIQQLIDSFLLIEEQIAADLSKGLLNESPNAVGTALSYQTFKNHLQETNHSDFVIVGITTDICGEYGGSRLGPQLIRQALEKFDFLEHKNQVWDYEKHRIYDVSNLNVLDLGDIVWNTGESIQSVGNRAALIYSTIADKNIKCITFGGDHYISSFPILELSKKQPLQVIQFDAHHDLYCSPSAKKKQSFPRFLDDRVDS